MVRDDFPIIILNLSNNIYVSTAWVKTSPLQPQSHFISGFAMSLTRLTLAHLQKIRVPFPLNSPGLLKFGSKYTQFLNSNVLHKQFFLFTHHKRDILHFLVVSPCSVTRCVTPVCNPIVLPHPCRVEVLEPFPGCVSPLSLPGVSPRSLPREMRNGKRYRW